MREHHDCCYSRCDRPGTVFIGLSRNSNCRRICAYHRDKWNADRARFLVRKYRILAERHGLRETSVF